VHFTPEDLVDRYRQKIDAAANIDPQKRSVFLRELEEGLKGYTYLEK
jgi:arginine decarboxylase-like protein